jgi:hypothetical protein
MVNAALQNTASMAMSSNSHTVGTNSIIDELSILGGQTVKALLDNMVSIQVLDKVNDTIAKGVDDGLGLD